MTALSDLINQRLAALGWDGLSLRDLAEKSEGALSKDNVAIYRKGTHGVPSETTLASWSDILQTPIEDLREAAGMPRGGEQFSLPPEAARLNQRQRRAITELIMSMIEGAANEDTSTAAGSTTGSGGSGVSGAGRAPMNEPSKVTPLRRRRTAQTHGSGSPVDPDRELPPIPEDLVARYVDPKDRTRDLDDDE